MGTFLDLVEEELKEQRRLLYQSERARARAPEGYLKSRPRKNGAAFYRCERTGNTEFAENITDNTGLVKKLLQKKINTVTGKHAGENVAALMRLKKNYQDTEFKSVIQGMSSSYREAAKFLSMEQSDKNGIFRPKQHFFDPESHIHETVCGLLVRSKSEVIIANTMTKYNIFFEYEKPFPYPDSRGFYLKPDFTIELPDGSIKLWEHLGLLKNVDYSRKTGEKLMTYQKYGFLIGRNLILTQDDERGNCSSAFIDEIVRTQLKPFFI